jgi:Dipeptidyl peptidase IV (DPP IV) N-terminal region
VASHSACRAHRQVLEIGTRLYFHSHTNPKLISFCVAADSEYYITAADWVGDSNDFISVTWMNRAQNLSIVTTCHHDQNWTCHGVSTNVSF